MTVERHIDVPVDAAPDHVSAPQLVAPDREHPFPHLPDLGLGAIPVDLLDQALLRGVELDLLIGREAEDPDPRLPEVVHRARAPEEIPPETLPLPDDQDVEGRGLRLIHRGEQPRELPPLHELRPRDGLVPVDVAIVDRPPLLRRIGARLLDLTCGGEHLARRVGLLVALPGVDCGDRHAIPPLREAAPQAYRAPTPGPNEADLGGMCGVKKFLLAACAPAVFPPGSRDLEPMRVGGHGICEAWLR